MDTKDKISKNLNLHSFFKSISTSFISLFVPIIILTRIDLYNTAIYLLVYMFSIPLIDLIFYKLIKFKPLVCILLNFILMIISYVLISTINLDLWLIILLAFLNGASTGFYYTPIQNIVCANKRTSNFASFQIFKILGVILITLFNGYILDLKSDYSLWLVCLVSALFFVLSFVPIFIIRKDIEINVNNEVTLKEAFNSLKSYQGFNFCFGIQNFIVSTIFPMFLLMNNLSMTALVYVIVIINIVKVIINIIANEFYKNNKSMIAIILGAIIFGVSCLVIGLNRNIVTLYIFSILPSITFPFFYLTTFKKYSVISKGFECEAILIREIIVHICNIVVIIPILFINDLSFIIYFGVIIAICMIVAAIPFFKEELITKKHKT